MRKQPRENTRYRAREWRTQGVPAAINSRNTLKHRWARYYSIRGSHGVVSEYEVDMASLIQTNRLTGNRKYVRAVEERRGVMDMARDWWTGGGAEKGKPR